MTDIKKILDEIDGLREVTRGLDVELNKDYIPRECALLIKALVENFPTLRDYIARLERESEAGKRLCASVQGIAWWTFIPEQNQLPEAQESITNAISAYRTACEGEEK